MEPPLRIRRIAASDTSAPAFSAAKCDAVISCVKRVPHIVTKHTEQQIARPLHLFAKKSDRFGERLVDGLVEANDIFQINVIRLT
jgi:hypothetical protein